MVEDDKKAHFRPLEAAEKTGRVGEKRSGPGAAGAPGPVSIDGGRGSRSAPRPAAGAALEEAEGSDQEREGAAEGARIDLGDRRAAVLEAEQAGDFAKGECLAASFVEQL